MIKYLKFNWAEMKERLVDITAFSMDAAPDVKQYGTIVV
jgi:hypothetical protein